MVSLTLIIERAKIYPDKDLDTYIFRTNNNILPFAMWY
jgi:hypothetical protein